MTAAQIGRYRAPCTKPEPQEKLFRVRSHATTALAALVIGNIALAFGPLFVRIADVGPVASGFWRIALAAPVLLAASMLMGERPIRASRGLWGVLALAGLAFAADLASWHIGIGRTTLANSTLFGNSATLIFPIYGFIAARDVADAHAGARAGARRGRRRVAARRVRASCRPNISPATCSACSRARSTRSISS